MMVVDNGYQDGLDALLRKEANPIELLKFGKEIIYYIPRILPGIGLASLGIRDWKTRRYRTFPYYDFRKKEDLKVIGKYAIQVGWLAFAIVKAGVTYKGAQGLINRINNPKDKTEQVDNVSRKDKKSQKPCELEKTVDYEKLFIK